MITAKLYIEPDEADYLEEQLGKNYCQDKISYLDGYMILLDPFKLDEVVLALNERFQVLKESV